MPVVIPAVALVLIAALAILLYYGAEWIGKAIVHFTPGWSIPGLGSLKDAVAGVVDAGIAGLQKIMYPAVRPVVQLIDGAATWITSIIGTIVRLGPATAAAFHHLLHVTLPAVLHATRVWAAQLVATVEARISQRLAVLRRDAATWVHDARAWAAGLVATATTALVHSIAGLRHDVLGWLAGIRSYAAGLVAHLAAAVASDLAALRTWTAQRILGVEVDLARAVDKVEGDITAGIRVSEAFAAKEAADAAGAVQAGITVATTAAAGIASGLIIDDLPALADVLATDFPDLRALLGEIDITKALDLTGALSIGMIMARVLTRYMSKCGIPNCRNLSQFGRALQDILGLVEGGAFLALLAELISDPEAMAREVESVFGPIVDATAGAARDLLGV